LDEKLEEKKEYVEKKIDEEEHGEVEIEVKVDM